MRKIDKIILEKTGEECFISQMTNITWEELKTLRDNNELIPGQQYRITDYVTTTMQENTISAEHQFDIIVTALDESTLSEEAKAIQNNNDDYFDSCNLSAWKIWYSLDNDINRFKWAKPYAPFVNYHYDSNENLNEFDTWIQAIAKVCDDSTDGSFYETIDDGLDETFSHFGYTNYNGKTQLTLYGRILEEDGGDFDHKHNYHYKGILTIDGVEYDSWAQLCYNDDDYNDDSSAYYATNGNGGNVYVLTQRIVAEKGKGVIYRMIDEWGNDCPYDFKNIQFKRWLYVDGGGVADEESGDFDADCYTFSWEDSENGIMDASIFGNNGYLLNDERQIDGVYGNIIGVYNDYDYEESPQSTKQYLNDIVFFSTQGYEGRTYYGCYSNTFGNDCYSNTFSNECKSNTFGNECRDNTFGNRCRYNTFGDYCYSNTFGYDCSNNTFGNNCTNSFSNRCSDNTFGNSCYGNTFGNDCSTNTFGNNCYRNTFGNSCYKNTFGNNCENNNFGNGCQSNTFSNDCCKNTFGSECSKNNFSNECYSNTFNGMCCYNTFGNYCYENSFNNMCYSNIFGDNCYSNTFSINCKNNTFGNECNNNKFGGNCKNNTFGNNCNNNKFGSASTTRSYYRHIIFDNGNSYIRLYCTATTGTSAYYQNVRIGLGVNNTNTYKEISDGNVGQSYETLYRPTSSQTIDIDI